MAYLPQGYPRKSFRSKLTMPRFEPEPTNLKFSVLEIGSRQSYQCWVEYSMLWTTNKYISLPVFPFSFSFSFSFFLSLPFSFAFLSLSLLLLIGFLEGFFSGEDSVSSSSSLVGKKVMEKIEKIINITNYLRTSQNYTALVLKSSGRLEFHNYVPKVYTHKMGDDGWLTCTC